MRIMGWFYNQMKGRVRNFEIQTKLGSGSYGVIYRAVNKTTKEVCVLKQIGLTRLNEKARKNAVNQAAIMGKLTHPFIVRYRESFIEDNTLNIVMQYCDSGDLSNYLKLQNRKPLKEQRIWRLFLEICVGLEYIHKNRILHRDIKTLNIFMNSDGGIKIGDLGVAKMLTSNQFAQTMVGTPFYLSPELCEEKPYNEKSDIWALGCLLYELCTYRHPFEAQNQASLILKIIRGKYTPIPELYSQDLRQLIDLCLERDYKRRPTTSNLLANHKMQEYYKSFGIDRIVDDYMMAVRKEKENGQAKVGEEVKITPPPKEKVLKVMDEPKKEVKKEQPKKQEPKIILPPKLPSQQGSQKKIDRQIVQKRVFEDNLPKRQSKNEFVANLERLIDNSNKKNINIKQGPSYADISKPTESNKKQDKYQKIAQKVEESKKEPKGEVRTPNLQDNRKYTPQIRQKKVTSSMENIPSAKKQEAADIKQLPKPLLAKPPMPPMPPSAQKEPVIKVKNEKIIQPKVYDSQKQMKAQPIIKSGGFVPKEQPIEKVEKVDPHSSSKDKPIEHNIVSAKRPSVPVIRQEKVQVQEVKQLFGLNPSPAIEHKSEKNFKNAPSSFVEQAKPVQVSNVSRVRKGGQNELSRNARNASRYNEISKEEKDEVMNLPNKLNNRGHSSSSEEEQSNARSHPINDLKAKTNKKFRLKEIDDHLVLQKYQDLLKNEQSEGTQQPEQETPETQQEPEETEEEVETTKQFERNINDHIHQDPIVEPNEEEPIAEDLERNSGRSDEQIEEMLESEMQGECLENEENLENEFANEQDLCEKAEEWSFDEEPELPLLQERQSPYFQEHNPYLLQQQQQQPQQQSQQNKINFLQTKLSQNLKRQDQINKLMQIKLDECRKFIPNQNNFQEILSFFRSKLNMEEEYREEDESEIESFLKRKGLTDHRKFQNIYKIMHFEMELDNTRKIIQRICKKLTEFQNVFNE